LSLRLLYVAHTLPLPGAPLSNVGGMQRLSLETAAAFRAHPQVELSLLSLESSSRWTGVRTVPFIGRVLRTVPRLVREEGIEVVLFSSMVTAATSVLLAPRLARSNALLAATPMGLDVTLPNAAYQRFVPRVFRALDLVLPISHATAAECTARGLDPARVAVVPCGIDVSRFPAVEDRSASRRLLLEALRAAGEPPLPADALLLCSVGRHQERKGFRWFVEEVMPRLPPDVAYLLAGTGPVTPAIRATVERHGLADRVRLLGRVSESMLATLYRGSDLFVMPNVPVPGDMEGFGVVILEAGLCGLPTLAADLEGIRDAVIPGGNGERLPATDADAFAAAVLSRRDDREALARASVRARETSIARFAWPHVVELYLAAFRAAAPR
jgi:phosphatidylinositol alpha-1,6-mannosyltransferase